MFKHRMTNQAILKASLSTVIPNFERKRLGSCDELLLKHLYSRFGHGRTDFTAGKCAEWC